MIKLSKNSIMNHATNLKPFHYQKMRRLSLDRLGKIKLLGNIYAKHQSVACTTAVQQQL